MGRAFSRKSIADRLHDVSKKVSSTIISEVALLLQVASKRYYCGLYGRSSQQGDRKGRPYISLQQFKDNYPLLLFYLIYKMAIGISYFLGYIMT